MTDLASLRPTDATPAALAAAISRCALASRGAAAEIAHLRRVRSALLIAGHPSQLDSNLAELVAVIGQAMRIDELLEQLQAKAATADHLASATPSVNANATVAAAAEWWRQHGPTVLDGARLAAAVISAFVTVDAATPATPASNVTPLRPQPAA